jgi:hypothetical protein
MFANTAFGSLCLTRKRNVTRRGLIPSGNNANKRLVDFFFGHAHRVVIRPMWRFFRANRNMAAWQIAFINWLDAIRHFKLSFNDTGCERPDQMAVFGLTKPFQGNG